MGSQNNLKSPGLGLDRCVAALNRYTCEARDIERDKSVWEVLVGAIMADERDHSKLPLPFAERCIVVPLLWAADMLPHHLTDKSRKFIADYAVEWLAKQKRRPVRAGRPIAAATRLKTLIVAAACAEDPRETGISDRKYYARVACRLNSTWYQVRRLHQKFNGAHKAGEDDGCQPATDEILQRIAVLMRSAVAEDKADANTRKSERHYRPSEDAAVVMGTPTEAEDSRC